MSFSTADDAPSDADLARLVTTMPAGSARAAEEALCRRFAPRVHAYGLRHLRKPDAAQDLVQQVLEVMLRKLRSGEVRDPERIASFVLGAARMLAHELRRRASREEPATREATGSLVAAFNEPEPLGTQRLSRCLDELGERERSIVLATYFADQSAAEIARALVLTTANVRVLRHRAMARLRNCLGVGGEGA